ncbi:MAG: T9SS type A sorting domain-containing protein [Bacteroidetes bacterium]|nr:T9SS type A sorting domain-containing protein [Bacteroidota bacterium]HET6244831.1 T9SS type A sorting domain-containing protein [Bacteroidia bacterium]
MRICFFLLLLLFSTTSYSQHIEWAKKRHLPERCSPKALLSDKYGNIYEHGGVWNFYSVYDSYNPTPSDTIGSFLTKYSAQGNLVFLKRWKKSFHVTKLIYDNNEHFYFSGTFSGNHVIDGITLTSDGNYDGMYGKMDLEGRLIWIKKISSSENIIINAICFYNSKYQFLLTGSVFGNTFINDLSIGNLEERSLFFGKFTSEGNLINSKTYNFLPDTNDYYRFNNSGIEIISKNGNLFALYDREGKHWVDDPTPEIQQKGRYLARLDENLNILWNERKHGPDSYYGWQSHRLSADSKFNLFHLTYTRGKYGGWGSIVQSDFKIGENIIAHGTNCGWYTDYLLDANDDIFLIGREACIPYGPASDPGHWVIKKLDQELKIKGELRLYNGAFQNIVQTSNGSIYASGNISGDSVLLGEHVLHKSDYPEFLVKIIDISCTPPVINVNAGYDIYDKSHFFCEQVSLDAGPGFSEYLWNNGENSQKITTSLNSIFYVKVKEFSGCIATSKSVKTTRVPAPDSVEIHFATVENNLNRIESSNSLPHITYFKVLKETEQGVFHQIDSVPRNGYYLFQYSDSFSVPSKKSDRYKLVAVDSCGQESPESHIYSTIHLKSKIEEDKIKLEWNHYEGKRNFTHYFISTAKPGLSFQVLDSVEIAINEYEITMDDSLRVQIVAMDSPYYYYHSYQSKSNIISIPNKSDTLTNIAGQSQPLAVIISPNPAKDYVMVEISKKTEVHVMVQNLLGEVLYQKIINHNEFQIPMQNYIPGLYIISLDDGINQKQFKLIKN